MTIDWALGAPTALIAVIYGIQTRRISKLEERHEKFYSELADFMEKVISKVPGDFERADVDRRRQETAAHFKSIYDKQGDLMTLLNKYHVDMLMLINTKEDKGR